MKLHWFIPKHQVSTLDPTIDRLSQAAELSPSHMVLMGIAGTLAAIALITDSVPILLGSMIIAPIFSPLALVAFAIVGGRFSLATRALNTVVIGLMIATLLSMLTIWGLKVTQVLPVDAHLLDHPLLEERVHPGWYSVAVAIAAGVSGVIALLKEQIDTLIGTVSAIAIVPAVAAAAVAFMSHDPLRGIGGLHLLAINIGLIIGSGVVTLVCMTWADTVSDHHT